MTLGNVVNLAVIVLKATATAVVSLLRIDKSARESMPTAGMNGECQAELLEHSPKNKFRGLASTRFSEIGNDSAFKPLVAFGPSRGFPRKDGPSTNCAGKRL
jgi:hypothetical protein